VEFQPAPRAKVWPIGRAEEQNQNHSAVTVRSHGALMNPIATLISDSVWPGILGIGACLTTLPWLRREDRITRVCINLCLIAILWRYMYWRLTATLPPEGMTVEFVVGVLFLAVELLTLVNTTVSLIFLTRIKNRTSEVEEHLPRFLKQRNLPLVDVFICTYNEESTILERTIIGALGMDYANYRVWVLDDGRRVWLQELCATLGCGYITRPDNAHAKAGNINNGIRYVCALAEAPQYISILDADFVPFPTFLQRCLALFHADNVGVVQTPQHFMNPDPIQSNLGVARVWPDEQRYFFDVVMASKDAWGVAFCCGTSSVIKLAPLMQIGGFPTDSVTEDYLVTLRLSEIGYKTIYLNERLTIGLAPEGLKEYVTQRSRWCLGLIQIIMGPSGPLRLGNGLSPIHRICLVEAFLYWAASYSFRLLGLGVPVLYLLFGVEAVHADFEDALTHFVPYFVVQSVVMAWLTNWRLLPIMADVSQLLAATEILRSVAQGLIRPTGHKFKVTAKGGDRSKLFVQWPMLRIFVNYFLLTAASVILAFLVDPDRHLQESSAFALFWSWYNLVILIIACFVCIEQPRRRKAERFAIDEVAYLSIDDRSYQFPVRDVSTTGLALIGRAPAPLGTAVAVEFFDRRLSATIIRSKGDEFAVRINDSLFARSSMIKYVYSGRLHSSISKVNARHVVAAVVGRLLR
jgi:cellulose synthase (UDP-forming)